MVIEITTKSGEHIKLTTDTVETININQVPVIPGGSNTAVTSILDEYLNGSKE